MTVVGTPYYMSPEVCQNSPYTQRSDVWSLGCVLYELCTLKHAFSADNLLGLVYKIVQDKYEPIPACYSIDLQELIHKLLNKDPQSRPTVAQVLQLPIVRKKMEEFVLTGGKTIGAGKGLYVKNTPTVIPQAQMEDWSKLTAKEKMKRRKQLEADKRRDQLAEAAKNASFNYAKAKEQQYSQLYAGPGQPYQ